jgi:hypothetical protein
VTTFATGNACWRFVAGPNVRQAFVTRPGAQDKSTSTTDVSTQIAFWWIVGLLIREVLSPESLGFPFEMGREKRKEFVTAWPPGRLLADEGYSPQRACDGIGFAK